MPFIPAGANHITLSPYEVAIVMNALRNRLHDSVVPVTSKERQLYDSLRAQAPALGIERGLNGWWKMKGVKE